MLNVHINENDQRSTLPFITETSGAIPMLHGAEAHMMYPAPVATAQIQGKSQNDMMLRSICLVLKATFQGQLRANILLQRLHPVAFFLQRMLDPPALRLLVPLQRQAKLLGAIS